MHRYLIFILLLFACGKPLPLLEEVNVSDWKADKNGCFGKRLDMKPAIVKQKDKLLSLSEIDLVNVIGKPDETELYKRSEKFYKYYFHGGAGCAQDSISPSSLVVRFNAMGLAKEVVVE